MGSALRCAWHAVLRWLHSMPQLMWQLSYPPPPHLMPLVIPLCGAETAMRQLYSNPWYFNHIKGKQVGAALRRASQPCCAVLCCAVAVPS